MINRESYAADKILNQINLLQQAIKCRTLMNQVSELHPYVTQFAMMQLVFQDENKKEINEDLEAKGQ